MSSEHDDSGDDRDYVQPADDAGDVRDSEELEDDEGNKAKKKVRFFFKLSISETHMQNIPI